MPKLQQQGGQQPPNDTNTVTLYYDGDDIRQLADAIAKLDPDQAKELYEYVNTIAYRQRS